MKITYAICVCNEHEELHRLVTFLKVIKDEEDDINILVDTNNVTSQVEDVLRIHENSIKINRREFDDDFGKHRNYHFSKCNGDYIFIVDADELPRETLVKNIKNIIKESSADLINIPRVNIIPDLTSKQNEVHGFNINEYGWLNWPDYQGRIFKNNGNIKYEDQKLHERLSGAIKTIGLPASPQLSLWHVKYAEKQLQQHNYYKTLN